MAIQTVTSKAGKEYNADSHEGKMITNMGASKSGVDKGSSLGATAIVNSLRSEFKGLNAHLAFRFEDIKKAILGTPAEQRAERITSENTDKDPGKDESDPPGDKKGFMETLKGLNPFSDGIGTKTGILLLAGTLFAISKFGDKLVKPLASVLEMIDREGGMLDKFKDTEFFKNAVLAFEKIKTRAKEIKEDVEVVLASINSFIKLFKDAFKGIKDWVKSYDEDDSGTLEKDELEKLVEDVIDGVKNAIWSFVGEVLTGFKAALGLAVITPLALKLLFKTGLGTGALTGVRLGSLALGGALLGAAAIAGIIVAGIWTLTDNATTAYNDAITDEFGNKQDFDTSEFVSRLLGGKNPEGGWWNALGNAWDKAVIGAAIGAGVGGIVGAAAGFVIGGVAGAVAGKAGSDKIDQWISAIETETVLAIDTIGGFFTNVIKGFKALGDGDKSTTFMNEFNKSKFTNKPLIDRQMKSMNAKRDELAESNLAIESGKETPLFGESFIFSSTSPLGQYLNSISLFGKRLSQDVDGAALEALDTDILEFETEVLQYPEKIKREEEQKRIADKLKEEKNAALRAKVEETYNPGGRFDGLGAYYNAIQPVKIDAPTINKLENNISGQPSVDNARFGIGLININSSIAGY